MPIITEKALLARINRKLSAEGEQLRKSRGARCILDLGEFYVRDFSMNFVSETHVDPEALGRDIGVLKHYETVRV